MVRPVLFANEVHILLTACSEPTEKQPMPTERDNVQGRIPKAAKESLLRLCKLTDRTQTKLIEIFVRNWEQTWLGRMTEEEKKRYFAGEIGFDEANLIRQRATMPSPQPPQAA
jgi:hypothetical protein